MKNLGKICIFFAFFCQSCDCFQKVEGTINDEMTLKPISDVAIYKISQEYNAIKSDVNGKFDFSDITGSKNCKRVTLVFSKINYKNDTIMFDASTTNAIVILKK